MDASREWVGSVWSHREGRIIIGRLLEVRDGVARLAVVGMGPAVPEGVRLLPPDPGGTPLVELPLDLLLSRWKRLGGVRPERAAATPTVAVAEPPRNSS